MKSNYILFDGKEWTDLLPLTYTRPVAKLRIGMMSIEERWKIMLNRDINFATQDYLAKKYSMELFDDNTFINGSVIADPELVAKIKNIAPDSALVCEDELVAIRLDKENSNIFLHNEFVPDISDLNFIEISNVKKIEYLWDLFQKAEKEMIVDFELLTKGKKSATLSDSNTLIGPVSGVFIEEGARIEASVINTSSGPVYISAGAEIMEGCLIRGPFFMDENSVLKMGAKIYGATSIGKYCKIGGEVNNTIFMDYSNKAHDGFIGNSVIGEWCNLGADTNNSNLKNNYAKVKIWSYRENRFIDSGSQFCGLFMGDHSKSGINTMFNTGTVVGVSANIFGSDFPRNMIPSFSWGGNRGFTTFTINKALETASLMMERRGLPLDDKNREIMQHIYEITAANRVWEKKHA